MFKCRYDLFEMELFFVIETVLTLNWFAYTQLNIKTIPYQTKAVLIKKFAQSAGALEYTDGFFAEGLDPPPTSVLDMTLNNQMVRFQQC